MELLSSATSGVPSRVALDRVTARRQSLVSARMMAEYLGRHRRPFLVADVECGEPQGPGLAARSAAALGFLVFADSAEYLLEGSGDAPGLDIDRLGRVLAGRLAAGRDLCVFGMTHLLHAGLIRPILARGLSFRLPPGSLVAHIGGWKRLRDESVDPDRFLADIGRALGVGEDRIIDFYGFTEQMGLVYGGAGRSPKTCPTYAEIIIRDFDTLRPATDGRPGLVQVLTPLPFSYPGISVLTEDVGRIVGRDGGGAGPRETRFEILGRAEGAEPRGCGDL
jgi:hypothetical protein